MLPTLTGATAEAVDKTKIIIPRPGGKGKTLKVEIINEEHNLLAVGPELLPEEYKGHILILYLPRTDAVAINTDNQVFKELAELISEYLSLDDWSRKIVLDECSSDVTSKELIEIIHVLNRIIRIRRKLHQSKNIDLDTNCLKIKNGRTTDLPVRIGVDV